MQLGSEKKVLYDEKAPELLNAITSIGDDEYIMKRDTKTDYCISFSDGLCGIQNKYGADFLGDACYFYPRVTRKIGQDTVLTGTLSCPEIARLALMDENAFLPSEGSLHHFPTSLKDYCPSGLDAQATWAIHTLFLHAAMNETVSPEHALMQIYVVAQSLERIDMGSWHEAVPFYLGMADAGIAPAVVKASDMVYLLQSLCGLVFASKKIHNNARLVETIHEMEAALHVTIRMDNLAIVALPDSVYATENLLLRWQNEWAVHYAPIVRRYLIMQLSLAIFPFGGFGDSLTSRIAIIGIRLATIKLALMSAISQKPSAPLTEETIIRVVQSLSRFLDHLSDPEFSLKIYQETGWLQPERLRGLLQC